MSARFVLYMDNINVDEVIAALDSMASGGSSRMSIKVSEELMEGESVKAYHHGRCDIGSPFESGKLYDFEDGCNE